MGQVLAQADQDAAIWTEWVNGSTQAEIGERRGLVQSTVSAAIRRHRATIPEEEKAAHRERALARLEELYAAHRERALTSTRAASLVTRIVALEARLLGLEAPTQVEVDHGSYDPGPTPDPVPPVSVAQLLDQWRAEGKLRVRGELVRTDGGPDA
jgi:hypothetical protein